LADAEIAGFTVTTLVNEPLSRVGEAITDLYRSRRRDDLTLLYFTGHGLKDIDGRLYFAMTNTRRDSLLFTALSAEDVERAMASCASRKKVLILDCCYSGAYPAGQLAKADDQVHTFERFEGSGRTVLTASDATQFAWEGDRPQGDAAQSVFTRCLVEGLRTGSADIDGDGNITLDELYDHAHDCVVNSTPHQEPNRLDRVEGRIVIARNVNWTMPTYLSNEINSPLPSSRRTAVELLVNLHRRGNEYVRSRAIDELRRLSEDDSKTVSEAAAEELQHIEGVASHTEGRTDPDGPAVQQVEDRDALPDSRVEEPPTPPAAELPGPRTTPEQPKRTAEVQGAGRRPWLSLVAGLLAVSAAALMVIGALVSGVPFRSFREGMPLSLHPFYAVGVGVVGLVVGACLLAPKTRLVIGPGAALGAAAASLWGLVYFGSDFFRAYDGNRSSLPELVGHLSFLAVAVLAGIHARRRGLAGVSFTRPHRLRDETVTVLFGSALILSAGAMSVELYTAANADVARPYFVATVLAVMVPAWAAMLSSRRFGLAVLAGWVAGGLAISVDTWLTNGHIAPGLVMAGSLVLLMVASALRRPSQHPDQVVMPAQSVAQAAPGRTRRLRLIVASREARLAVVLIGLALVSAWVANEVNMRSVSYFTIEGLAVSPDGRRLYIASSSADSSGYITVFDTTTAGMFTVFDTTTAGMVGSPIPVGKYLQDIAVTPDGMSLYLARSLAGVSILDTRKDAVVGDPIAVEAGAESSGDSMSITITSDGTRAFVVGTRVVSIIDTATNKVVGRPIELDNESNASLPGGETRATISPDGGYIYTSYTSYNPTYAGPYWVTAIDVNKQTRQRITLNERPDRLAISPDGRKLYIKTFIRRPFRYNVRELDTTTRKLVGNPIAVSGDGAMVASPDGSRLYLTGASSVEILDATRTAPVETIGLYGDRKESGLLGSSDLEVSRDGRFLYVLTVYGTIAIIEIDSGNEIEETWKLR
jgi:DNA-binding beta-propeller fold protein YncE